MDRLSDDDGRPAASPVLAGSDDERAIGENFCQPPLAELPFLAISRLPAVDLSLFKERSFEERSFDDLSFDGRSFEPFEARSFEALPLNDRPFSAPAAAARLEKKC
jgi:hypothetical protein